MACPGAWEDLNANVFDTILSITDYTELWMVDRVDDEKDFARFKSKFPGLVVVGPLNPSEEQITSPNTLVDFLNYSALEANFPIVEVANTCLAMRQLIPPELHDYYFSAELFSLTDTDYGNRKSFPLLEIMFMNLN